MKNDEFFYCFAVQKRPFCPNLITVFSVRTSSADKKRIPRRGKMKPWFQNLPKYRVFHDASHQHMPSRREKNSYGANVSKSCRANYRQSQKTVIFTIAHKYSFSLGLVRCVRPRSSFKQHGFPWGFNASIGIFCPYAALFFRFGQHILCYSLHSVSESGRCILFCGIRPKNRTDFCMRFSAKLDFLRRILYNVTQIK